MTHLVLSLIAKPGSAALDGGVIAKTKSILPPRQRSAARWLSPDEAWEIRVECNETFSLDDLAALVDDAIAADVLGHHRESERGRGRRRSGPTAGRGHQA